MVDGRFVFVDYYPTEAKARLAAAAMGLAHEPDDHVIRNALMADVEACRAILQAGTVNVTLDGRPASITGFNASSATVQAKGSPRYQWPWITAMRILSNEGGQFHGDDGRIIHVFRP